MPVKFALAALVASVASHSEALVVWLSLPVPFFAALAPVGEWKAHLHAFSFKNSTASPPLLRMFLALPQADSFDFFFLSDFSCLFIN